PPAPHPFPTRRSSDLELVERTLERSGYLEALEAERTIEAQGRVENLQELVGVAREYQENADEPSLSHFLQEISLYSDQDAIREQDRKSTRLNSSHVAI